MAIHYSSICGNLACRNTVSVYLPTLNHLFPTSFTPRLLKELEANQITLPLPSHMIFSSHERMKTPSKINILEAI